MNETSFPRSVRATGAINGDVSKRRQSAGRGCRPSVHSVHEISDQSSGLIDFRATSSSLALWPMVDDGRLTAGH